MTVTISREQFAAFLVHQWFSAKALAENVKLTEVMRESNSTDIADMIEDWESRSKSHIDTNTVTIIAKTYDALKFACGVIDVNAVKPNPSIRMSLCRVKINRQGYDNSGCYWGVGGSVYEAMSDDGKVTEHHRASNREEAKAYFEAHFPNWRFAR